MALSTTIKIPRSVLKTLRITTFDAYAECHNADCYNDAIS